MKYIDRDKRGVICSINAAAQYEKQERIGSDHPEIISFFEKMDEQPPSLLEQRIAKLETDVGALMVQKK